MLLNAAQAEASQLINTVFFNEAGSAPYSAVDPGERVLCAQLISARTRHGSLAQHLERYTRALSELKRALSELDQSLQLLSSAEVMTQMDTMFSGMDMIYGRPMHNSPGGMMMTMYEREQAKQGIALAQRASEHIITAYQMFPGGIPHINLQALQQLGPGFFQIFFNNIFSDLMLLQSIRENIGKVRQMERDVQMAIGWMQGTLERDAKPDLARAAASVAQLNAQLDNHRRGVLIRAVEALQSRPQQQACCAPAAAAGVPVMQAVSCAAVGPVLAVAAAPAPAVAEAPDPYAHAPSASPIPPPTADLLA